MLCYKTKSSRATNVMPPPISLTMTIMPRSTNATEDDKQPQSNMVQYDELPPPPAYQERYETLQMPHAPLTGFSQHCYPKDTKQGYPLGQEPSLAKTLVGYSPEHTYESIN